MFRLVFTASIFTEHNTTITGPLQYSWDYGDGTTSTTGPTSSHSFSREGDFNVACTVMQGAAITVQGGLQIRVFEGTHSCTGCNMV